MSEEDDSLLSGNEPAPDADNGTGNPAHTTPGDRPEWLLDRFATEGKSMNEAISEQAKGYNELRSKLGAFTGAPDVYEVNVDEDLGIELDVDNDPLLQDFKELSKEMGVSQDGFNKMVNLYLKNQAEEIEGLAVQRDEQLKALGHNADERIKNVNDWINANFAAQTVKTIENIAVSADAIEAIEAFIGKTRNAMQNVSDNAAPSGYSNEELNEMLFAVDENGNRKMSVDPEYKKRVESLWAKHHGKHEHKVVVGH